MAKALVTPFTNHTKPSTKFMYTGGCSGGRQENPPVGPSDHGGVQISEPSGQPNRPKSSIGQGIQ